MKIKLTPEALRDGAQRLSQVKADNDDVLNRIDALINGLVAEWHGEAQEAFANSYANKKATFQQFSLDMEAFIRFLNDYARVMEDQEKLQAGKAAGL